MAIGQKGWPGHYLSAYGIAQKRGFRGTEQEWLQSLHGADVEMQTEDGLLQWKKENDADWKTLASFSDFTDGAVSRAEAAAREVMGEAVKNANEKAARAETAAGRADASAGKADAATDRANTAKAGADNAAQNAGERAGEARQSATAANSAATAANDAAAAANGAAGTANSAAETARAQGDYAEAQGDVAKELTEKLKETDIGGMAADILALQSGKVDKASAAKRTCRFVVGTSTAGWTENDCDYLCDGVDDQVEINAAIQALPVTGGEVRILDGTYNILAAINITKSRVSVIGNRGTILKRDWGSLSSGGLIRINSTFANLSHLEIDCGNNTSYEFQNNIGIDINSTFATITHCYITYADIGIKNARNYVKIAENTVRYCREHGIFIYGGRAGILEGNLCCHNEGDGICSQGKDWTICNNQCYLNEDTGIKSSDTQSVIIGNSCCENTIGIRLYGAQQCSVLGNICTLGDGLPDDYPSGFDTLVINGEEGYDSNHNLISNNMIMGKNYICEGGTGNEFINNKFE